MVLLQEGGNPFQGPKLGSCLILRNELSEEVHVLTKQEILLGKGTRVKSSGVAKYISKINIIAKVWKQSYMYANNVFKSKAYPYNGILFQ